MRSDLLIGLALGVYGLGQMLLQIPLGLLSDRIGRKPAITLGLLVFVARRRWWRRCRTRLMGIVIGRALQGMGAVAGAGTALAADLTARGKPRQGDGHHRRVDRHGVPAGADPRPAAGGGGRPAAACSPPPRSWRWLALVLLWLIVPTPAARARAGGRRPRPGAGDAARRPHDGAQRLGVLPAHAADRRPSSACRCCWSITCICR